MPIKVVTNVPMPETRGRYSNYPFGDMPVGGSFLIGEGAEVSAVRQAASHFARRSGKGLKFAIRKVKDGHRCWRIA